MSSTHVCTMFLIERITIALLFLFFLASSLLFKNRPNISAAATASLSDESIFVCLRSTGTSVRYVCHGRWYRVDWYQWPATVCWYQPLVPETGQCDICLSQRLFTFTMLQHYTPAVLLPLRVLIKKMSCWPQCPSSFKKSLFKAALLCVPDISIIQMVWLRVNYMLPKLTRQQLSGLILTKLS